MSWVILGWMTFSGRLDLGWLAAWGLTLGCIVPFRLWSETVGGKFALDVSAALRRRLLAGAVRLDPDQVRREGTGGLLGRALELETLEQLALGGGLQGAVSLVELLAAVGLLGPLAGQWLLAGALVGAIGITAWMAKGHLRRCEEWTSSRLRLTNDLVDRMIGHRTALAQQSGDSEFAAADQAFERYLDSSRLLDQSTRRLQTAIPRIWLLCGILILAPDFVQGRESVTSLAIALGGILFARQGLQRLMESLDRVLSARVSWRRMSRFLESSRQLLTVCDPEFAGRSDRNSQACSGTDTAAMALEGRDLVFRYALRNEPVLNGVDIAIRERDHVLLTGPSGGGKSTLGMVLAGSRALHSGTLLLRGLDPPTLGTHWRRQVVLAPQFHHNHVFLGTLLYNLLLGSTWPPSAKEAANAERLCRELELGPLLDRMPGGLQQMVGETGWQLSHGECSRLFLARAMLQGADVVLLDESFAALDPDTLSRTLPHVADQTPTLVVIAHL
jgi:ATP-binding cassette subfamily B protein